MRFCSICKTKIPRSVGNTTKIEKCSKCDSVIEKYNFDKKIINEWDVLFEKYLGKLSGRRIKEIEEKIDFYKSQYLKKIILDMGHDQKVVNEILCIHSILWIKALMDKSIELDEFNIYHILDYSKSAYAKNKDCLKNLIQMETIEFRGTEVRSEIFRKIVDNLKIELIKIKLNENKLLSYSTFIQWTHCKNNEKHLELDLTKITRMLNYHRYEIIFVKSNNIVAEHRKTKNCIFLNLIDSTKSNNWDISLHILGKLIMNLGKPTANKSRDAEGFGDWDQGAITKYDWHACNSRKSRHDALKQRLHVEGFDKTFGTIKGLQSLWSGSNHPNHDYLPEVEDDFLWLQTYPTRHQSSKNKLSSKYKELQKNNEQLKNKKPNLMFFVNVSE